MYSNHSGCIQQAVWGINCDNDEVEMTESSVGTKVSKENSNHSNKTRVLMRSV